jgi:NodT family efflux transporter outer membrane factor (OMF) lipoprotein
MIRFSAPASSVALLFLLGGCALNNERAQFMDPPPMEQTLSRAVSEERRISVGAWPEDQWWRQLHNQDLNRIVDIALDGNPGLKKAADRLGEADALARVEGAKLFPFVDADLGMRQSRIPNHGVVASYNPELAGKEKTMAFVNPFSFRYEFDFWGKNRAALAAVLGEAAAAEAELAEARLVLTASIVRTFIRGAALAQQAYIARQMVRVRRELLHLAESRFRSGLDTADVVRQAVIDLETANKREAATQALLVLQQDLLARLMGSGPDATMNLFEGNKVAIPKTMPLPAHLPVELLAHRPDLAAAMHRAEAAAERIHMAKAQFLPSIDLTMLTGLEASVTSTHIAKLASFLFRASAFNYQVMPGLHLPLFEGGRLRGHLEATRSEYDEAVDLYNETLLQAAQQVADSLSNWKQTRAILDSQNRLLASWRAQFALIRARSRTGLNDRREILTNLHSALDQMFALKALEADHLSARIDLIQALGGGYWNGVDVPRPQIAPEEALGGLETLTPAWILDDLSSTLLPLPRN